AIENVRLFEEVQARTRDLTASLERQTATNEVLAVIAHSPAAVEPVLQTVADNAARLCGASQVLVYRVQDARLVTAAAHGALHKRAVEDRFTMPIGRGSVAGRAILEKHTIQVSDWLAVADEFPDSPGRAYAEATAVRT